MEGHHLLRWWREGCPICFWSQGLQIFELRHQSFKNRMILVHSVAETPVQAICLPLTCPGNTAQRDFCFCSMRSSAHLTSDSKPTSKEGMAFLRDVTTVITHYNSKSFFSAHSPGSEVSVHVWWGRTAHSGNLEEIEYNIKSV